MSNTEEDVAGQKRLQRVPDRSPLGNEKKFQIFFFFLKRNLMLKFIQILIIFYRYKHKPMQSGTNYDEVNSLSVITAVMINFSLGTQIGISECIFKQTIQFLQTDRGPE